MNDRIAADLRQSYGLSCNRAIPVTGGWLNKKWRVIADAGDVLVKQYSPERYDRAKLEATEAALQRQVALRRAGVPCPRVWLHENNAIRFLDDGTAYMVMDFSEGSIEGPHTVTAAQMRSLGDACARMHLAFAQLPAESAKGYPLADGQVLDTLWSNYRASLELCTPAAPPGFREAVHAQRPILDRLAVDFLAGLPKGLAHEDFTPDNILLGADGVMAIIDFDRNQYSYVWHDVGRAMLSFALRDKRINMEIVHAFLEGYARHAPLTMRDIADALRLSWCLEIPWWIQPGYFEETTAKVVRFRQEMLWLTECWDVLDDMLA